jgi:hypothetical protein
MEFANLMVNAIDDDCFLRQLMYTDEGTCVIGHLNRHNCGNAYMKFISTCETARKLMYGVA